MFLLLFTCRSVQSHTISYHQFRPSVLVGLRWGFLLRLGLLADQFSSVQIPVTATHDACGHLAWTLLGIIFFLRSLHSKFSSQCLPSDIVPIRSWTRTLRPPGIRHRHLPYHTIPVQMSRLRMLLVGIWLGLFLGYWEAGICLRTPFTEGCAGATRQ